jgi:hypothetical protein
LGVWSDKAYLVTFFLGIFLLFFFGFPRKRSDRPTRETASQIAANVLMDLIEEGSGSGDDFVGHSDVGIDVDEIEAEDEAVAALVEKTKSTKQKTDVLVAAAKEKSAEKQKAHLKKKQNVSAIASSPKEVVAEAPVPPPAAQKKVLHWDQRLKI